MASTGYNNFSTYFGYYHTIKFSYLHFKYMNNFTLLFKIYVKYKLM